MKTTKKIIALLLVCCLLFTLTSCSTNGTGTLVGEAGTEEGEALNETWNSLSENAEVIYKGNTAKTANNNTIKLISAKDKNIVMAPLAFITIIYDLVVMVAGGLVFTPGWISTDKDHNIVDVKFKFTNESEHAMFISDVVTSCIAKVGNNYYNASLIFEKFGGIRLETETNDQTIAGGKSKKLHLLLEIPDADLESNTDIDILFVVDGTTYLYDYQ